MKLSKGRSEGEVGKHVSNKPNYMKACMKISLYNTASWTTTNTVKFSLKIKFINT